MAEALFCLAGYWTISVFNLLKQENYCMFLWHHGVAVVTMAQLHSTKPELRFCAGSNSAHYMSEICDGENL